MRVLRVVPALLILFAGCAFMKPVARTANEIARSLCELTAAERADELAGMSPEQWCAVQRNLDPFIRELLSAQRAAAHRAGLSREKR